MGDRLYFYTSGRKGVPGTQKSGDSSTGLSFLRRDGFASVQAGDQSGVLITRPVIFKGSHLFVNIKAPNGQFKVQVLDPYKNIVLADSKTLRGDSTIAKVQWGTEGDIAQHTGKPVRLHEQGLGRRNGIAARADSSSRTPERVEPFGPRAPGGRVPLVIETRELP